MDKEELLLWIERLDKTPKSERKAVVAELSTKAGLKMGDAWKLLKEAGYNAKSDHPVNVGADGPPPKEGKARSPFAAWLAGSNSAPGAAPKIRIRHAGLKNSNLIVRNVTVSFDGRGTAEVDAHLAEHLLNIPGYEEDIPPV
jgi:hypothetical protein